MSLPALQQDQRVTKPGICGLVQTIGRTEWICIAKVHDDPPRPGHGQRSTRASSLGYHPKSERHYFVPRRPWRRRS